MSVMAQNGDVVYHIDLRKDLDAALELIAKLRAEKAEYHNKYEELRLRMHERQEVQLLCSFTLV